MITITRRSAHHLRSVFRRAFGTHGPGPALCFTVAAGKLNVKASSPDMAVEYSEPASGSSDTIRLPGQFLDDCAGKRDEPVHVEVTCKGCVAAQWRDGNVPQLVKYDMPKAAKGKDFPAMPENFAENPARLLRALADASEGTDPDSVRYALGHLQLRGPQGSIGAADGRQLLVQSGFVFPWEGDLLIPHSKVFGSPELAGDGPVLVGQPGDWVAFRVGAWTCWLAVNKDGRFPDLSRHILRPDQATARCVMSAADAAFLTQVLPRLPTDDTFNHPITVDLNGSIAIRAKAADQAKPTEIVLSGSSWSGEPVRLNMNRQYLARALKLGFHELCVYGPTVPVVCHDETRDFVWATLDAESAIPPAADAIRIESPSAGTQIPVSKPKPQRRTIPVSDSTTSNGHAQSNGHAKSTGQARKSGAHKASQQDIAALIVQAEKLRTASHDLMHQAGVLVKALKQHRRQNRVVQNTLASLRQLKGLGV